jgi:hypothetical protein
MTRLVKVTVLSPAGGEYQNDIPVADNYDLPPISDKDDWVEIEGADGSVWAMPTRLIVGIVLQGDKPLKKPARKGTRITH